MREKSDKVDQPWRRRDARVCLVRGGPWQTKGKQLALWSIWIRLLQNLKTGKAFQKSVVFSGVVQMEYYLLC